VILHTHSESDKHPFLVTSIRSPLPMPTKFGRHTIRYDSVYLTCSKKPTGSGSQLSLSHGVTCVIAFVSYSMLQTDGHTSRRTLQVITIPGPRLYR